MTNSQIKKLIEVLHKSEVFNYEKGSYEIKKYEVDENEFFVNVILEVGMKNDEGTYASIVCRDHVQLFIYKKGRIEYPTRKRKTKTLKRNESLLTISLAQKYRN